MLLREFSEKENKQIEKSYLKSFSNFINKCPLIFSRIEKFNDTLYLYLREEEEKPIIFKIHFEDDVNSQISTLKEMLLPAYPVFYRPVVKPLSTKEKEALLAEGKSLDDVVLMTKTEYKEKFIVLRIHNKKNEIDIQDIFTSVIYRCKVNITLLSLLYSLQATSRENNSHIFDTNISIFYEIGETPKE